MPLILNQPAPDFTLPSVNGEAVTLSALRGKPVLINFWSAECPWAEQADRLLVERWKTFQNQAVWISIASNANETSEQIREVAQARALPLVLVDAGHRVADLYEAMTTPHCFVLDANGILRYHGALDDTSFRQRVPARFYALEALEAILKGEMPAIQHIPSYGCTIVREMPE